MNRILGALFALTLIAPITAHADPAADCAAVAQSKIENTNLLSATVIQAKDGMPEYCRVLGYVRPAINFEIRLPTAGWNNKFMMAGCGGFCGTLDSDRPGQVNAMNHGLRRGYAVSTSDSGHWGTTAIDGRWAMNNPVAIADWGWRAVTETTRVTKSVIKTFYAAPLRKSYFNGCSNGGRQALMEASRFPDDFDGIIAGAPAMDAVGIFGALFPHLLQANTGPDNKPIFTNAKLNVLKQLVTATCADADGLVQDPRACKIKPAIMACREGDLAETCFTKAEVTTLEKWYAGPTDKAGKHLYAGGIPPGSEIFWPAWLTGTTGPEGADMVFGREYLRYLGFPIALGVLYDPVRDYAIERDFPKLQTYAPLYTSSNPDLSKFNARGGKLIIYQGWADAIVTPYRTVDYYDAVTKAAGGRATTEKFARLFMVPGMDHCGGSTAGPGIDQRGFDPLTALELWTEQAQPPTQLATTKLDAAGKPKWSRPVCPFPQTPKLKPGANTAAADSYTCAD